VGGLIFNRPPEAETSNATAQGRSPLSASGVPDRPHWDPETTATTDETATEQKTKPLKK
jgi:hypothetical protein